MRLGFPRPLVDRVAKALETYDSVMVRRDLEAEGGFAQFFARPGGEPRGAAPAPDLTPAIAAGRGLIDGMGQLNHERGVERIPHRPARDVARAPGTSTGSAGRDGVRSRRVAGIADPASTHRCAAGALRRVPPGTRGRAGSSGTWARARTWFGASDADRADAGDDEGGPGRFPGQRRLAPRAAPREPASDGTTARPWIGRSPDGSTPRAGCSGRRSRRRGPGEQRRAHGAGSAAWIQTSTVARSRTCPTGSAGWSCAPGSTGFRAISRSIAAACSSPPPR